MADLYGPAVRALNPVKFWRMSDTRGMDPWGSYNYAVEDLTDSIDSTTTWGPSHFGPQSIVPNGEVGARSSRSRITTEAYGPVGLTWRPGSSNPLGEQGTAVFTHAYWHSISNLYWRGDGSQDLFLIRQTVPGATSTSLDERLLSVGNYLNANEPHRFLPKGYQFQVTNPDPDIAWPNTKGFFQPNAIPVWDGAPHHYLVTWNANGMRLYVDGVLEMTFTEFSPRFKVGDANGELRVDLIGSEFNDFAIWDRELTSVEIDSLWDAWNGGETATPSIEYTDTIGTLTQVSAQMDWTERVVSEGMETTEDVDSSSILEFPEPVTLSGTLDIGVVGPKGVLAYEDLPPWAPATRSLGADRWLDESDVGLEPVATSEASSSVTGDLHREQGLPAGVSSGQTSIVVDLSIHHILALEPVAGSSSVYGVIGDFFGDLSGESNGSSEVTGETIQGLAQYVAGEANGQATVTGDLTRKRVDFLDGEETDEDWGIPGGSIPPMGGASRKRAFFSPKSQGHVNTRPNYMGVR